MDILMKISEKTGLDSLEGWDDETEKPFWRSPEPIDEPIWVYFINNGCITGKARYVGYRYEKDINIEGEEQEGNAFILKGPIIKSSKPIEIPKDIIRGSWRWRYLTEEILDRINLDF